jgi:hypothetical protein
LQTEAQNAPLILDIVASRPQFEAKKKKKKKKKNEAEYTVKKPSDHFQTAEHA